MSRQIEDWVSESEFRSLDSLAERLRELWLEQDASVVLPKKRSISAKLGRLLGGDAVWWRNHDGAMCALASALGVSPAELREAVRGVARGHEFPFDGFPELPPFDPTSSGEVPCELWDRDWFSAPAEDAAWITSPHGAGRSFVAHWHRVRETAIVLSVRYLREAALDLEAAAPGRSPLIVEVEGQDLAGDRSAARVLQARGAVWVLAPFARPGGEGRAGTEPGRGEPDGDGWHDVQWKPFADWRVRLADWVERRLERAEADTLFSAIEFVKWISQVDPREALFQTPGDLVPLCGLAAQLGVRKMLRLSGEQVAERWLLEQIEGRTESKAPHGAWLRVSGARVVRALARARLEDTDVPPAGPLPMARWVGWLPEEDAPSRPPLAALDRVLEALVEEKAVSSRRRKRREVLRDVAKPAPEEAIPYLVAGGLLRSLARDHLDLWPRWTFLVHAQERIREAANKESPAVWGRWAIDRARQPLVDAVLDELAPEDFKALLERLGEFDQGRLGWVGAVEALVVAVGRRVERGWCPTATALRRLVRSQLRSLVRRWDNHPPVPVSRYLVPDGRHDATEWVVACWTLSLRLDPPRLPIPDDLGWLFPGWKTVSLADLKPVGFFVNSPYREESMDRAVQTGRVKSDFTRWLKLAPDVVARCADEDLADGSNVPFDLWPLLVLAAPQRGWTPRKLEMGGVLQNPWMEDLVVREADTWPEERRRELATCVWKALVDTSDSFANTLATLRWGPRLGRFVLDHLPELEVTRALERWRATTNNFNWEWLEPFSPALRTTAVRWLCENARPAADQLLHRTESTRAGDLGALEALTSLPGSFPAVQRIWKLDPARGLERATHAFREGTDARVWFSNSPATHHQELIDVIAEKPPEAWPSWVERILVWFLVEASGSLSDRAYEMMLQAKASRESSASSTDDRDRGKRPS